MFMAVSLVNCGSDDEGEPSFDLTQANLVGTYRMTSFEGDRETTVTTSDVETNVGQTSEADTIELEITINSNGTFSVDSDTDSYRLGTTVDGSDTVYDIITVTGGSYTLNTTNSTLTLSSTNGVIDGVYSIDEFDMSELVVSEEISVFEQGDLSTTTITGTDTFTFTRN